jgi:hypothetical protein
LALLTKYYYADQIKENDVGGASGRRGVYRILVGKPEGVRQLGRHKQAYRGGQYKNDSISKMVVWPTLDSSDSAQKHVAGCGNHGYDLLD